ncbi:7221_t:CDS:1, partial [Acaulospora morrowiae]
MIDEPINSYFVTTWLVFLGIYTSRFIKYFTEPEVPENVIFRGYFALFCNVIFDLVLEGKALEGIP